MIVNDPKPSLDELTHHGVKGMHWGVRKEYKSAQKNFNRASLVVGARQDNRRLNTSLSEEQFNRLNTKDVLIKKGSELKRTSENPNEDAHSPNLFLSTNKEDAKVYRALVPTGSTGGFVAKTHEVIIPGHMAGHLKNVEDVKKHIWPTLKDQFDAEYLLSSEDLRKGKK